jgi:Ca2+-binding EF-hand superfamily protein
MKKFLMGTLIAAFTAGLLAGPSAMADEKEKKKRDPEAIFKKLDKDSDSKLTVEEFTGKKTGKKAESAVKRFAKIDKDGNKSVSLEEFKAAFTKKKKKK